MCTSNSRKKDCKELRFVAFPKPSHNLSMARKWVNLCRRKDLTIKTITRHTYVCSLHFEEGTELDWRKNPSLEPVPLAQNPIFCHPIEGNATEHMPTEYDEVEIEFFKENDFFSRAIV